MSDTTPTSTSDSTEGPVAEQMQAVVVHGPGDYRLTELPVPTPQPGELLIRVESVGVCASDLKCYQGAAKFWGDENRPPYVTAPVTPGHEIVGHVVRGDAAGLGKHGVAIGDRVVVEQIVPCWECRYCLTGAYLMCGPHDMFGFRHFDGGMAEYMIIPGKALVHTVSADLAPQHAPSPSRCPAHCTPSNAPRSSSTTWS